MCRSTQLYIPDNTYDRGVTCDVRMSWHSKFEKIKEQHGAI